MKNEEKQQLYGVLGLNGIELFFFPNVAYMVLCFRFVTKTMPAPPPALVLLSACC